MKRNVIFMLCITAVLSLLLLRTTNHSAAAESTYTDLSNISEYLLLTGTDTSDSGYDWNRASEYVQMDSHHCCNFLISGGCVRMNMVYASGATVSFNVYDYPDIVIGSDTDSVNNTYLESYRIADNRILLLVKNYLERQARLYLFTSQNDYQYIGTYSCAPVQNSVSVFEDGCILMNGNFQYTKIDLQTGQQKVLDAITPEDWLNALPWKIEGIGYFIFDNDISA